jgi:thymidylate synthase (FAD)
MILKRGHFSVIEHESASVRFICDRGITHEIVRHRLASYSQESTRYCNYSKEKFGNEITVIDPRPHYREEEFKQWCLAMKDAEHHYFRLIAGETSAQLARDVLPTSLKTEIVMTANLREWRHFFDLRTSPAAHPQLRELTMPLLAEFRERIPVLFDDVGIVSDE